MIGECRYRPQRITHGIAAALRDNRHTIDAERDADPLEIELAPIRAQLAQHGSAIAEIVSQQPRP